MTDSGAEKQGVPPDVPEAPGAEGARDAVAAPGGAGPSGSGDRAESHGLSLPEVCREAGEAAEFIHPADLADHLENLSLEKQVCALRHMPKEDAAEALAELEGNVAVDVLENLDADVAAQIIAEMAPDDAADVLDELDEDHRDVLLEKLTREDSEELRNLLNFDPDSAAGVMNTELILLERDLTVDEAIAHIRREMADKESPYYGYVVDGRDVLVGVLSLRDLMLARPGTIVGDAVAGQNVVSVTYDTDKGEVANLLSHYNYLAMPVVDYEGHIMGVVTYDDIMDIIHDEASADMLGMVGADPEESVDTPWLESVRKRLPWLAVNMLNSAFSASVVYMFEGTIAQMAVLAVLMPMVANQAGNTGQQALAVMIRQLATDRFDHRKAWKAVLREGKIGLATGLFMAGASFLGAWWFTGNRLVGCVMGGAILCDMILGAVAGGSIPLIFRALGRDPAQASSIFLTTLTDGAGFFIFLGLASLFLF
ncbi:magnesium transporter [uncultured Desulfovibrio sp.]|uniref:magnesium transporter n=1 Tax=uncultured Desulfovibrio sp. TaxID=167968 RepID=UPI002803835A|nr:magnesium transporter [uncultured Desulfovibrio sp.]